jgi:hypothetical protein
MSTFRKRFSRRDFLRMAGGTALSLPILSACAKATEAPTQAPESGGETTGLVEGQRGGLWLAPEPPEVDSIVTSTGNPNFFTVVPWHMIEDYGFAQEEGFDKAELIVSNEYLQGVAAGDIHFANAEPDEVAIARADGVPLIQIATYRDREWHMMGLSPSVKVPEDLIGGKAIMGSPGTRTYAQRANEIRAWSNGTVNPETDLEPIVISGGSDAYHQAIISDQVQIGMQYNRHIKPLLDAGCTFFIAGIYDYPQESIVTNSDFADKNPRTIVNFLRSYLKSLNQWYDITMKPEIKSRMFDLHELELSQEFDESWVTQVEMMAPMGMWRSVSMRIFLDEMAKWDVIPPSNYQDFYDASYLRQAQTELYGLAWPPQNASDVFTIYGLGPGDY